MSLDTEKPASAGSPDLQSIAAKLDVLNATVSSIVRSSRIRNFFTLVIAVVSVLLIGFWLAYAHTRFTSEVNPELVAALGQKYLEEYLPSASDELEKSLKAKAPEVVQDGANRLKALPVRLDEQFRADARKAIEDKMPDVQERLYQSLKAGLADATAQVKKSPGEDDATRFRNLADSLATLYRTEALKFTDETYAQYSKGAGDVVNGLTMLAEDKNLTAQQKTQRNLVRDFLTLAHSSAAPEPRTLPETN